MTRFKVKKNSHSSDLAVRMSKSSDLDNVSLRWLTLKYLTMTR
jgi:hypothetical protein